MEKVKLYIRQGGDSWTDASATLGLGLENGGLEKLMAPAPNKEPVVNKNVVTDGAMYVAGAGLKDVRTIALPVHLRAATEEAYLQRLAALYAILDAGFFELRTNVIPTVWTLHYLDCQQFRQFLLGKAKFTLMLEELNPRSRGTYSE